MVKYKLEDRYIEMLKYSGLSSIEIDSILTESIFDKEFQKSYKKIESIIGEYYLGKKGLFNFNHMSSVNLNSMYQRLGDLISKNMQDIGYMKNKISYIIRIFPTGSLNACISKFKEGYIVLVNRGLTDFYCILTSLLLRSIWFQDKIFGKRISPILNNDALSYIISDLFTYYLLNKDMTYNIHTKHLYNSIIRLNEEELFYFNSSIQSELISFVLTHELSHLAHDHMSGSDVKFMRTPLGDIQIAKRDVMEEFVADTTAVHFLFNGDRIIGERKLKESPNLQLKLSFIFTAIMVFCISDVWIEEVKFRININKKRKSEPSYSGITRLRSIENYLFEKGIITDPKKLGVASTIIQLLEQIESKVIDLTINKLNTHKE